MQWLEYESDNDSISSTKSYADPMGDNVLKTIWNLILSTNSLNDLPSGVITNSTLDHSPHLGYFTPLVKYYWYAKTITMEDASIILSLIYCSVQHWRFLLGWYIKTLELCWKPRILFPKVFHLIFSLLLTFPSFSSSAL